MKSAARTAHLALGAKWSALLVLAAVALLFPVIFPNPVVTNYGVFALIFATAASAWNVFSGFSGYISLGQAVFFGSGAYAVGIAARDWQVSGVAIFALLPLAALVGAAIAIPFGLVALRVRRHTFIVVTIAVFFIFQLMAFNFSFTGGSSGLPAPFLAWQAATYNNPFYYIALACTAGIVAASWLIRRARFGLHLRAIRDDEDRARGLGVRAMRVKLAAFTLSGAVTGLIGGVWFLYITQVEPQTGFDPLFDLSIVLMAFLGGLGTVAGPVLGALIIEPGQLYLTIRFTNGYYGEILLGAIFLAVVLLMPRGIIPTGGEWIRRLATRGRSALPVPAPQAPGPGVGPEASQKVTAPQAPGPVPGGPEGPRRRPGTEDPPPEASEAPAREARQ
jgi:branched-chain amino acid transport system permease protein